MPCLKYERGGALSDKCSYDLIKIRINLLATSLKWKTIYAEVARTDGWITLANASELADARVYFERPARVNTLRPRQDGRHFPDDILKCIFLNENVWISIKISLKFIPKGPINNIQALVQIMAWCRPGNKPLSGPMMVSLPTYICVIRPQWVNAVALYRWCQLQQAGALGWFYYLTGK